MNDSRRVAREWLLFVVCLVVGILAGPMIAQSFVSYNASATIFYGSLIGLGNVAGAFLFAWTTVFLPYAVIALARSVWWAVRNAK
jgi:hypothetical protein